MTSGLPETFLSPRVNGTYQGCEVIHHQDKVEVRIMVMTKEWDGKRGRKFKDTRPLVLMFSPNTFADFRFELYRTNGDGDKGGMWTRYQHLERQAARVRKHK